MHYLVTGGCGFIGSHFIRRALKREDVEITNIDLLTYAGNPENLRGIEAECGAGYQFHQGDVADAELVSEIMRGKKFDAVIHFAAESFVDRSIARPRTFVHSNVNGTFVMLEAARAAGIRFVQISTDEVYGSLGETGLFTENTPLAPSSPYSASKASADLLALANHRTFGQDVVILRCSNNFGPRQHPEKFIPRMILCALRDDPLPVYGDGLYVRDWIHVEDHCAAIQLALDHGRSGEIYNIGSGNERRNIDIVRMILAHLGKPASLIRHVEDRPGHDRRYAIDSSKARAELGWSPEREFHTAFAETIAWYAEAEVNEL
ncbi:MAG TPA: dTDP-glucose 4,6-dehydratase [Verrucomicrobiales bacterium]|jgi:dTDP-glucose 4,6-dehydratase|nr:dTDP-glucose 4,6-dehydratase [Verrucomicrobiales bacterium]